MLTAVVHNSGVSVRSISRSSKISRMSVQRNLKRHKLHLYKVSLHQELHGHDLQSRVTICEWAQDQIQSIKFFFQFRDCRGHPLSYKI